MFEKEVMISSIKKQSETLRRLVQELEEKTLFGGVDRSYYHATLKEIEFSLRKIRRTDEEDVSGFFSVPRFS